MSKFMNGLSTKGFIHWTAVVCVMIVIISVSILAILRGINADAAPLVDEEYVPPIVAKKAAEVPVEQCSDGSVVMGTDVLLFDGTMGIAIAYRHGCYLVEYELVPVAGMRSGINYFIGGRKKWFCGDLVAGIWQKDGTFKDLVGVYGKK